MRIFRATNIILALLCLMYFITYLDRVNVSTASGSALGFGAEFGLSNTQIGLVFSAFAYPYLVFQIIGGWVSDRFGTRRTLIVCGLVWAAATALSGLTTGLVSMLIARVLLGLGEGATFPAATSAMSRWVPKSQQGWAQGVTHAGARVGNAIAPIIIAYVMVDHGWRASFFFCAILSFVWVILWMLAFRENPADHPRITQEELDRLPPPRPRMQSVPWVPLFKRMWPVTIVYFCYGWTLWLFLTWVPQYFLHHDLDLKKSALFAACVFFSGVVGDSLGGLITDWIYKKTGNLNRARSWMVSVCMFLCFLVLIPLMFTRDLYISLACLSAGFFFAELTIGPMWSVPMDIAHKLSGTASGMMNSGSAAAAIISPVVSGYLIDVTGNWELPFVGSMILMLIGMSLTFRMRPGEPLELEAK
jgi:MFS family permease